MVFPHWSDKFSFCKVKDNKIEFINLEKPNRLRNKICNERIVLSSNVDVKSNRILIITES